MQNIFLFLEIDQIQLYVNEIVFSADKKNSTLYGYINRNALRIF